MEINHKRGAHAGFFPDVGLLREGPAGKKRTRSEERVLKRVRVSG